MSIWSDLGDAVVEGITDAGEELGKKAVNALGNELAEATGFDLDAFEACFTDFECAELVEEMADALEDLAEDALADLIVYAVDFGTDTVVQAMIEAGFPPELANVVGALLDDVAYTLSSTALQELRLAGAAEALNAAIPQAMQSANPLDLAGQDYGPGTALWKIPDAFVLNDQGISRFEFMQLIDTSGHWLGVPQIALPEDYVAAIKNPGAQFFQPLYAQSVGAMLAIDDLIAVLAAYLADVNRPIVPPNTPEVSHKHLDALQAYAERAQDYLDAVFAGQGYADWYAVGNFAGEIDGEYYPAIAMYPAFPYYIKGPDSERLPELRGLVAAVKEATPVGSATGEDWQDLLTYYDAARSIPGLRLLGADSEKVRAALADANTRRDNIDYATSFAKQAAWEAEQAAAAAAALEALQASGLAPLQTDIGASAKAIAAVPLAVVPVGSSSEFAREAAASVPMKGGQARTRTAKRFAKQDIRSSTPATKKRAIRDAAERVAQGQRPPQTRVKGTKITQEASPAIGGGAVALAGGLGVLFALSRLAR